MTTFATADVVARLDALPPAKLEAPALLARLRRAMEEGTLTRAGLVEMQPQIAGALKDLDAHVEASERIVERCKSLPPLPAKTVPAGF